MFVCFFPFPQYVTQTVEVESPATLKHLTKARQRNELLSEKLSSQNERCKQLEEQIRKSDEHSCNLQHKVTETTVTFFLIYHNCFEEKIHSKANLRKQIQIILS